jgi:hypothetical protein
LTTKDVLHQLERIQDKIDTLQDLLDQLDMMVRLEESIEYILEMELDKKDDEEEV